VEEDGREQDEKEGRVAGIEARMPGLKIVFLGTPEIACPFLDRMVSDGYSVSGVVSQPDRPRGRGMNMCCTPVKNAAGRHCLDMFQPCGHEELSSVISDIGPDLGVVVAYGRKIRKEVLGVPRLGFINIHFSLLPAYRGAAPVQWALINGETSTGVTAFWLDEGMDTGPIYASRPVAISQDDYAPDLFRKTAAAGLELLSECLSGISAGRIIRTPQTGSAVTAPRITPADTWLDFGGSAASARDLVRGLACGPRARFAVATNGRRTEVQVLRCSLPGPRGAGAGAGVITEIGRQNGFFIQCRDGELLVEEVQPEGKKPMKALDFANGARLRPGDRVGGRGAAERDCP